MGLNLSTNVANIIYIDDSNRDKVFYRDKNKNLRVNKQYLKENPSEYDPQKGSMKPISQKEAVESGFKRIVESCTRKSKAYTNVTEMFLDTYPDARTRLYKWTGESKYYTFDEFVVQMENMLKRRD